MNQKKSPNDPFPKIQSPNVSHAIRNGTIVLAVFAVIFFSWGFFSPIESAAIAEGMIVVDSMRKSIQHLEGGIIAKLNVKEGSVVKKGEPLIQLDVTQTEATAELLRGQAGGLMATAARLSAERDDADEITYPAMLLELAEKDPDVKQAIEIQRDLFQANKDFYEGRIELLDQKIAELNKGITSLNIQVSSVDEQVELIEEETKGVEVLEKENLIGRPTLLALKRRSAELLGRKGELTGNIARTKEQIQEARMQKIHAIEARRKEILEQYEETQDQLFEVLDRLKAAEDRLSRTTIVSPISGVVVDLQFHTLRGVIGPGEKIMDIVPIDDKLIVEAFVNPLDIDVVRPGLQSKVRLIAYKMRSTPTLNGEVIDVSADVLTNPRTNAPYYSARVEIPKQEIDKLPQVDLYPGMPVQVMIVTGARTPFQYLTQPVTDSFKRAFREQ